MEHCTAQTSISRDQKRVPSHVRQCAKLRDMLMSDDPILSYADVHHETTRSQNPPVQVYSLQSWVSEKTTHKEDELVRYMSKLPSYLEKGKNLQEQALNVGVLDWNRLEKWRHSKETTTHNYSGCSLSSSNTSLFSTDESPTNSSRGPSCSPADQRTHCLSLQSLRRTSPVRQKMHIRGGDKSQDFDVFRGNAGKFPTSKSLSEKGRQSVFEKSGVAEKTKNERNRSTKETPRSLETKSNAALGDCSTGEESGVVRRNWLENNCSGAPTSSYLTENDRLLVEPGPRNISRRNNCEDIPPSKVHSRKCSIGSQDQESVTNSSQASKNLVQTSLINANVGKAPCQASPAFSCPARMLHSPSREGSTEETKLGAKPFEELEMRKGSESIPKARNQSPIRRLSFSMGKMIKNAGSRDNSPFCKSTSEGAKASTSIDNSINNARGRSSPLRRLLDPLLKKNSSPPIATGKSCNELVDCCNSVKLKPKTSGTNTSITDDPHCNSKSTSSSLQALLQVTFKNGVPLFTFATDNESDVLAATVRKSSILEKCGHSWAYTFFTVRETKRKSGVSVDKCDSHDYVPNVVAQMKVSDSRESPLSKYDTREFNLFEVDVRHEDPHAADFHPTNELAAIIVKLPRISSQKYNKDDQLNYNWLDLSHSSFTEERSSDDDFHRGLSFSTTIIVPDAIHTIVSKGEISTLVQRWRSGGSCDCGGWDLGCQLLLYRNKIECEGETASSASCSSENIFQLFSRAGQDTQPQLSLAQLKERIYSVEFNSSLSVLQAFAVCISVLDCKRPARLSKSNNVAETITDEVSGFDIRSKMKTQVNGPVRYVSFPPHATVERV